MQDPGRVVILGAGPTGLAAAYRLAELGHPDFVLLEAAETPGGLASSHTDEKGFTWDVGGHVQFSHYSYYDDLVDRAVDRWLYHERSAWIWIRGRFVPYPLQNNLRYLDAKERNECIEKLETIRTVSPNGNAPENFKQWIASIFGEGIAGVFLYPYNFKVWAYPLETLSIGWMGERVALPDLARIRKNIEEGRDDVSWGPNNKFRFPERGGTGAIWSGVARLLPPGRLLCGRVVTSVDTQKRTLRCADGSEFEWDTLISSLPLDTLCQLCKGLPPHVQALSARLVYSSTHILGVGLKGRVPASLESKSWMYFPEPNSPYYRVTVFSNYSPENAPPGHWSLMAEVAESRYRPVDPTSLKEQTLRAMREDGLIPPDAEVVSFWRRREEHGYPTPSIDRDEILASVQPALEKKRIFSRGRFGAWTYEVSNQDHSAMQGVELVNRWLLGEAETTLPDPHRANSGIFLRKEAK